MNTHVYNDMYANQNFVAPSDIKIISMLFAPTKQYTDIYRRPYEMNVSAQALSTLETVVGDQIMRGGRVNPLSLANSVPDIMKMSDVPTEKINIANGWDTIRLRFLMEVESVQDGITKISYIQGYSDFHDPSISGRIDPNMPLHINSITNTIRTFNPGSNSYYTRVQSSFNVIYDPYSSSYSIENTTNNHRLLRPKDIVDGMDMNKLTDGHGRNLDTRSLYGALPQESKRGNSVGVQHMSTVINGVLLGNEIADVSHDAGDIFNTASSGLDENNLGSVPFIEALSSITNNIVSVEFTLQQLLTLDPNIENVLTIADNSTPMFNANIANNILDCDVTATMDKVSVEATVATTISESISGLLMDDMLSSIDFSITNMTPNSENVVAISAVKSFIHGIDVTLYADRFISKFEALVMPAITKGNLIGVDLFIHADILGETTIAISLNGNPPEVYRLPTFCNSLFTSMVSMENEYNVLVEDFSQVLSMTNLT